MPLNPKPTRAAISQNIGELIDSGRSKSVAAAAAFREARDHGYKDKTKRKEKGAYGG